MLCMTFSALLRPAHFPFFFGGGRFFSSFSSTSSSLNTLKDELGTSSFLHLIFVSVLIGGSPAAPCVTFPAADPVGTPALVVTSAADRISVPVASLPPS